MDGVWCSFNRGHRVNGYSPREALFQARVLRQVYFAMIRHGSIKRQIALAAAMVVATAAAPAATNTAEMRLFCQSVRVEKGSASTLGLSYFIEFSSFANWTEPNAEFFTLLATAPPTHFSFFLLTGDAFQGLGSLEGGMRITVPEQLDIDLDGVPDFYQVARAIDAVADGGEFQVYDPLNPDRLLDYGTVRATWRRAAGQHRGEGDFLLASEAPPQTAVLPASGLTFRHNFEIIEFAGTYQYQPAVERIDGRVNLAQVGNPERTLQGPLPLVRNDVDPVNALEILVATWTNQAGADLEVTGDYLDRYPEFELEYYGPLVFTDGDLSTTDLDYEYYYVAIADPNDHDENGIPDLSDPPVEGRANLGIQLSEGTLVLTLTGEVGNTLRLQTASNPRTTGWINVQTVTLTNSSQNVTLPTPSANTAYWRTLTEP